MNRRENDLIFEAYLDANVPTKSVSALRPLIVELESTPFAGTLGQFYDKLSDYVRHTHGVAGSHGGISVMKSIGALRRSNAPQEAALEYLKKAAGYFEDTH